MCTSEEYQELRAEITEMPDKEFFGSNLYPLLETIDRLTEALEFVYQFIPEDARVTYNYGEGRSRYAVDVAAAALHFVRGE